MRDDDENKHNNRRNMPSLYECYLQASLNPSVLGGLLSPSKDQYGIPDT
jgi:hypothetical protein